LRVAAQRGRATLAVTPGDSQPTSATKPEEKAMSNGKFDKLKGRAKEAAGDLTDNDDLKDEGKVDKASGSVKDKVDKAGDKVKDAVNPNR
jgi:uncharacterized protein YjbJ (UPF0337 family)